MQDSEHSGGPPESEEPAEAGNGTAGPLPAGRLDKEPYLGQLLKSFERAEIDISEYIRRVEAVRAADSVSEIERIVRGPDASASTSEADARTVGDPSASRKRASRRGRGARFFGRSAPTAPKGTGLDVRITLEHLDLQEEQFARAFGTGDIALASDLYHRDVVYISPTTRLFGRPPRIEGLGPTLEFIQMTIAACRNISYRVDERALSPGGQGAYTRVVFDWDSGDGRLRSTYVVVYRYRDGLIVQQELYYDPNGPFERLSQEVE